MNEHAFWKSCEETQFSNKYYLKKLLGVGGFGAVYRADEVVADRCIRTVALKIFNPFQTPNLDAFIQEFQTTANLRHPHLIETYALEEGKLQGAIDSLGLVMELAGEDLAKHLERSLLTVAETRSLVQQVAEALKFLHSKGIIHRDIKPHNIMAVGSGADLIWKVGDLGIVRVIGNKTATMTTNRQGSPFYVPPEAYSGEVSPAMDLWALGVTITQVLTGKLPFPGPSEAEVVNQVLYQEPVLPEMEDTLAAIVRGCLVKDRKNRWTAQQILETLNPTPAPSPPQQSRPPQVPASYRQERSAGRTENLTFDLPNNGGELELIAVPAGTLVMEGGHRVQLPAFHIGKYPVTQRQYQAVMGNNPSRFTGDLDRPVECVKWSEAIAFCQKLSELLKQDIDLPSETMWEWAARGATKSKGYTYSGSNNLDEVGWYRGNSGSKTQPVGQKKPNELGIYDMSGNVWEWCKDNWTDNTNVLSQDGTALTQGGDSTYRAVRGGSSDFDPEYCRCNLRIWDPPDSWLDNQGFRVCVAASAL